MADECVSGGCTKDGRPCPVCGGEVPPSLGFKPRKYCSKKCLSLGSKGIHERLIAKHCCMKCGCEVQYSGRGPHGRLVCDECKKAPGTQCECKRCGKGFVARKPKDYCSDRCRWPRQLGDIEKCPLCRSEFRRLRHHQRYCSEECSAKAIAAAATKTVERNKARARRRDCQNCGRDFVAKNRSRCAFKYCSRECAFEARRLKKGCAARPLEIAGKLAKWFLSWGDDRWPEMATCGCGRQFAAQRSESSGRREACPKCRAKQAAKKHKSCPDCGGELEMGRWVCVQCGAVRKRQSRRRNKNASRSKHGNCSTFRKRCRKYGAPYEPVSKKTVMDRDRWKCRLCGNGLLAKFTTIMGTRTPHPRSPTIDHIIPLSFGPSSPGHVFDNCQAACWECNCERGIEDANSFAARKATAVH